MSTDAQKVDPAVVDISVSRSDSLLSPAPIDSVSAAPSLDPPVSTATLVRVEPSVQPVQREPATAPEPVARVPRIEPAPRPIFRLVVKRLIKSGLIGGKKFEVVARVESARDLGTLFKGYPDELVLAYKSAFVDKSFAMKRSELVRGTRFSVGSLNEIIELEERLQMAFDQLRRMVDIIENGDADVAIEG